MSDTQNKNVQIKKRKKKKKKKCTEDNCNSCNKKNKSDNNDNSSKKTSKLCSFGYVDYMILSSTLAIALGEELSSNDLSILASFFATLSDELALITSVKNCNSNTPDDVFIPPIPDVAITRNTNNPAKTRKTKYIKKK